MRVQPLAALGIVACLSAGCGGRSASPTSPTTTVTAAAAQPAVSATVALAITQIGITPTLGGSISIPCPSSGSMTITPMSTGTPTASGDFSITSRTEFNNCRSGSVLMNGDPYLDNAVSFSGTPAGTMTSTVQTTGGIRFDVNGQQGRVQYNCTQTMTMQGPITPGVLPPMTIGYSGSITWEQPLGSTPVTRACSPTQ